MSKINRDLTALRSDLERAIQAVDSAAFTARHDSEGLRAQVNKADNAIDSTERRWREFRRDHMNLFGGGD